MLNSLTNSSLTLIKYASARTVVANNKEIELDIAMMTTNFFLIERFLKKFISG